MRALEPSAARISRRRRRGASQRHRGGNARQGQSPTAETPTSAEEGRRMAIEPQRATRYYGDLREYLGTLEARGMLRRVAQPVNKDTELHPLVRLQFRGLPLEQRIGWLFEQVTDVRGRRYDMPVAVGVMASSPEMYALGLQCGVADVPAKWEAAISQPLAPVMVARGACQEVVYQGAHLLDNGGLDALPIPISTPGFDNAPYLTAAHVVTRD